MIASLFYLISTIALLGAVFFFPKSGAKQNAVVWFTMGFMLYECYTAFVAGLFSLAHIPVSIVSIGIVNCLISAALVIMMKRKRDSRRCGWKQEYEYKMIDLIFVSLLFVFIIVVFVYRFCGEAAIIYATIDPADRYSAAMHVVTDHTVIYTYPNLYFGHINNALFIQMCNPIFPDILSFRAFEIKELINVWLAGLLFYSALRGYSNRRFSCAAFFVLSFVYVLAYPWNNELWGFGYLGLAVSLIIFVQIGVKFLLSESIHPAFALTIAALGCFGVGFSYTLFAPPVYIATFMAITIFVLRRYRRDAMPLRLIIVKRLIPIQLAIFAVPSILTVVYTLLLDRVYIVGIDSQMMIEGAIFRNMFTDFLPYLPFAILALFIAYRKRKWDLAVILAPIFFVFQLYFFYRMYTGSVSTYYYFKLNPVAWFLILFLAGIAIEALADNRRNKAFLLAYAFCWFCVAFVGLFGYDVSLNQKNYLMNPVTGATSSFQIYENNLMYFRYISENIVYYRWDFIELCDRARTLRADAAVKDFWQNNVETISDSIRDAYWVDALVNEHIVPQEVRIQQLPESDAKIWVVMKDSELYKNNQKYIDGLDRVFENECGFIVCLR